MRSAKRANMSADAVEEKETLRIEIKKIEEHLQELQKSSILDLGLYFMHMEGTYTDSANMTGEEIMRSDNIAQKTAFQKAIRENTFNNPVLKKQIPDVQARDEVAERASFFPFLVDKGNHLDILGPEKGVFQVQEWKFFLLRELVRV